MLSQNYKYDLGSFQRKVTTSKPTAQLWFDRGLIWVSMLIDSGMDTDVYLLVLCIPS